MAEALDLNIPLGEDGAESVEKIIKPLLDFEKNKTEKTEENPASDPSERPLPETLEDALAERLADRREVAVVGVL